MKTFLNRYGDKYYFECVRDNVYTIVGDLKYWRFGGLDTEQPGVSTDFGFADPSGGPWIGIGSTIEGKKVTRIWFEKDLLLFAVTPLPV